LAEQLPQQGALCGDGQLRVFDVHYASANSTKADMVGGPSWANRCHVRGSKCPLDDLVGVSA
jgi:hypothetical protein